MSKLQLKKGVFEMIEEKTYTIQEMRELLKTNANKQGIERMLQRKNIEYSVEGRGEQNVFTLKKVPPMLKFIAFCKKELNFAPQTNFIKLRNFLYYYLNDEDFRNLPDTIKSARMNENNRPLGRPTIGNYELRLYTANYFWPDFAEFKYYLTHRERGVKVAIEVDRKTYAEAWALYWEVKAKTQDSETARWEMFYEFGGYPNKSPIINKSSIMEKKVEELNELVLETFYE